MTFDLDTLTLAKGAHDPGEGEMCVMEAVALLAGEEWSDAPQCASPVISTFLRSWNDSLPDDERQQLKRYIPLLIGTKASPQVEDARAWMCLDWLVRTHTTAWLRLAGLTLQADALAGLPEFRSGMDVPSIRPTIAAVRRDANAAWAAAWAAAWDAAGNAARAAAWDAARAAAWDAARAAAWDALAATKAELQSSAHDLVGRMIAATPTPGGE